MIEFLMLPANLPFTVALVVLLGLGALEIVGLILGTGVVSMIDDLLPDFGGDADFEIDVDFDVSDLDGDADVAYASLNKGGLSGLLRALSWLGLGRVPILIYLVLFLVSFTCTGLVMQMLTYAVTDARFLVPAYLAWLPALVVTIPITRVGAFQIARLVPKVETAAVSERTFIGRVAVITLGTARAGSPAQGRLTDQNGLNHYVLIEPDVPEAEFETGESVLLVKRRRAVFHAIPNPSPAMTD